MHPFSQIASFSNSWSSNWEWTAFSLQRRRPTKFPRLRCSAAWGGSSSSRGVSKTLPKSTPLCPISDDDLMNLFPCSLFNQAWFFSFDLRKSLTEFLSRKSLLAPQSPLSEGDPPDVAFRVRILPALFHQGIPLLAKMCRFRNRYTDPGAYLIKRRFFALAAAASVTA